MSLKEDLSTKVKETFKESWLRTDGIVVPSTEDLGLGNTSKDIDVTILYADISSSTELVQNYKDWLASEIYKNFLYCCSKIIKQEGGEIRSFDGDRIMGIFIGNSKNTSAARCALKINWCVINIIQKEHDDHYKDRSNYKLKHTCGIDSSKIMAIRSGIRGSNDLVWVGRSANYAAGLNDLDHNYTTWITSDVYGNLHESVKITADGKNMWEKQHWQKRNISVYKSNYWWSID